jgi:outer membrane protein OmpA-like peptidoglycan-associated protein
MTDARLRIVGIALSILSCAVLAGCGSEPDALAPVRQRVATAAADGATRTYAAGSLADAQRTLKLADAADEGAERDHFTYMTAKNLDIAAAVVARRQAERELDALRKQPRPEARGTDAERKQGNTVTAAPLDPPKPAPPPARDVALTIPDISFGSGAATLSPGAKRRLDPIVASLHRDPALNALVEGYTDDSGGHEANLQISLSRAKAVRDYLVEQGIAAERIQTLGHGEQYPIASNATEEGRSRNRRIEIVVHRAEAPAKQDARRH